MDTYRIEYRRKVNGRTITEVAYAEGANRTDAWKRLKEEMPGDNTLMLIASKRASLKEKEKYQARKKRNA